MQKTRYKLWISYNGCQFSGWQWQKNVVTVQGCLEQAVLQFCGEHVHFYAAGRTDTGVHALSMVAHVDLLKQVNPEQLALACNFYLKDSGVVVLQATHVSDDFHARFSAKARQYMYRILIRPSPCPIRNKQVWHVSKKLNIDYMEQALSYFIGQHNFDVFRSAHCQAQSAYKTLTDAKLIRVKDEIHVYFLARSFLQHQIRFMMGILVRIGKGKYFPTLIRDILQVTSNMESTGTPSGGTPSSGTPSDGALFDETADTSTNTSISMSSLQILQQHWPNGWKNLKNSPSHMDGLSIVDPSITDPSITDPSIVDPSIVDHQTINTLRSKIGPIAPPYGLYFMQAYYDESPTTLPDELNFYDIV